MANDGWMSWLTIVVPALIVCAVVSFVLLSVMVAVIRMMLLQRRIANMAAQAGAAAVAPPPAIDLWARGAYGLWTGGEDSGLWPQDRARSSLSNWYGANDASGLRATLDGLASGQTGNLAWDAVRAIDLVRIGVAAGYFDARDSADEVRRFADLLRRAYPSWEAAAAGFEQGMNAWQASRGITDPNETGRVRRNLPYLQSGVWPFVAWNAAL